MSLLHLPDELLEKTFLEARKNGRRALCSMLTVCRRTSSIAEQVLLQSVLVHKLPQLEAFARKVIRRFIPHGSTTREPGQMVRRLRMEGDPIKRYRNPDFSVPDSTPWAAALVTILVALPFLRLFALDAVPMTRVVIVCLVPQPTGCLTSLKFRISFDRGLSDGVLSYVNQLQGLEHLDITFDEGINYELDEKTFETLEALVLPGVKRFAWYSDFMGEADADYLAKCRFHRSCGVYINRFDYESDVSAHLAPFFAAHSFKSVIMRLTEDTLAGLASQIVAIDSVTLVLELPRPLELLHCGRLPAKLKINIELDSDEEEAEHEFARLWEFLRTVPPFAERGSRVTELSIITRACLDNPFQHTGREFRWSDATNERYAAFIEQLATEAIRLYKEGLVIVDEGGRNVSQRAG